MAIKKIKALENISGKNKGIIKGVLIGVVVILLGALGLELTNNDWDLGSLLSGESWSDSKIMRDIRGDVMRDKEGNVVTNGGKYADEYNCDDFATQADAQKFYDAAGGVKGDANRLDNDKDGIPCEGLP